MPSNFEFFYQPQILNNLILCMPHFSDQLRGKISRQVVTPSVFSAWKITTRKCNSFRFFLATLWVCETGKSGALTRVP